MARVDQIRISFYDTILVMRERTKPFFVCRSLVVGTSDHYLGGFAEVEDDLSVHHNGLKLSLIHI